MANKNIIDKIKIILGFFRIYIIIKKNINFINTSF